MTVGPRTWRYLFGEWCPGIAGSNHVCLPCIEQIQSRHGGPRAFAWAWRVKP